MEKTNPKIQKKRPRIPTGAMAAYTLRRVSKLKTPGTPGVFRVMFLGMEKTGFQKDTCRFVMLFLT